MPTAVRFDDVLEQLHHPDERERERAARQLTRLARIGLAPDQGMRALKASTLPYPRRRLRGDDTAIDLIRAALAVPYPEYLPQVIQRFTLWSETARAEVLTRLTRIEDSRAAEALLSILRQHARAGRIKSLPLGMYAASPQFAEVLFPEILDYIEVPKLRLATCQFALAFAAAHLIDSELLEPQSEAILNLYRRRRDRLLPAQQTEGTSWRWEPLYHKRRWQAGVLIDLLGFVPTDEAIAELRAALDGYTDPRLRLYACLGLLRQNQDVAPETVAAIAECPESRKWLYDGLQKLERFHLYPAHLKNQAALAESDLVDWLVHPRELGRAPDEIELMDVIPFDSESEAGWLDYYLFKFRVATGTHWAARLGSLVGLAGPFLRKDAPTIQAMGDTHSTYHEWDEKTLDEHVADVHELMSSWRERHGTRGEE